MEYTTRHGEKFNVELDFYPFMNFRSTTKIEKVVGNKIVLSNGLEGIPPNLSFDLLNMNWFTGYVLIHRTEVPTDFAYGYDRSGLESLNIHGGLTYHNLVLGNKEAEIELRDKLKAKFDDLNADAEKDLPSNEYMNRREDIMNWHVDEQVRIGYEWIIFGFDCNHAGDEVNPMLKNADFVFQLIEQMEQQIFALADVWDEFKELNSTDLKRIIIDNIRTQGTHDTPLGLGGMLKLLTDDI